MSNFGIIKEKLLDLANYKEVFTVKSKTTIFNESLLLALDDAVIIEKLRGILSDCTKPNIPKAQAHPDEQLESGHLETIATLKKEREALEEKNSALQVALEEDRHMLQTIQQELKREIQHLQMENNNLNGQLQGAVQQHTVAVATEKKNYTTLLTAYRQLEQVSNELQKRLTAIDQEQSAFNIYQNLPLEIRANLRGIFKRDTYENFVACCVQRDSIDALWLYIKGRIFNGELDHLDALRQIWIYAIDCYNGIFDSQMLALDSAAPGIRFDSEHHLRTPDSTASGVVECCLLPGCVICGNQKILQKAIVKVIP